MSLIKGETLVLPQENGPDVSLVVNGDEFYSRYTTPNGYTVVYDESLGVFCYAELDQGEFKSSRRPIAKQPLPGTQRQLYESIDVRRRKHAARMNEMRPPETDGPLATFGPNRGLLTGRQVNTGNVRGLTIIVEFQDVTTDITREQVDAMLNDVDFNDHGNFCSVRQYFRLMSSDRLDYTNDVVGPIKLSKNKSHYVNKLMVREALELAIQDHDVDLSDYDSRGDGTVDALSFMYAGRTEYRGNLWPHNSVIGLQQANTKTHFYTIQSLGRRAVDLSIGTFTHESGHMLCRFPDVYDYGSRDGDTRNSSGMGHYCLMSSGNHLGRGKVPAPLCTYMRYLTGWTGEEVDLSSPGTYDVRHGEYDRAYIYKTEHDNEFFLVENRQNTDLDQHLPDGGMAVYHCDLKGSNEWQDGTADRHYQCALLQADGRRDLERNIGSGDADDLYDTDRPGVVLSEATTPSTRQWDGSDSGLVISDLLVQPELIQVRTGSGPSIDGERLFRHSSRPDLLIPDDNDVGVASSISVPNRGKLAAIRLAVDISHTYRGDLKVDLASPSGPSAVLHESQGGQMQDLHLRLDSSDDGSPLAAFGGESIEGDWQLTVRDLLADDRGRLDEWTLEIDYEPVEQVVREDREPNIAIPDDDQSGVRDSVTIDSYGQAREVAVSLDVRHTYRGDLFVELVAPSGETVVLKEASSDSRPDLRFTFTPDNTPALARLEGTEIEGEWALRVRDQWAEDEGTLVSWSLQIKY